MFVLENKTKYFFWLYSNSITVVFILSIISASIAIEEGIGRCSGKYLNYQFFFILFKILPMY